MRRTGFPFQLVFGRSAKLRPYEVAILAAVEDKLNTRTSEKLKSQLLLLPYRQRQDHDRIVAFFPDQGNDLPEEVLFTKAHDGLPFAIVDLRRLDGRGEVVVARVYAAARRFFSIDFDAPLSENGIVEGTEMVVTDVKLTGDPDPLT
jgi:hypothetical protein